MKWIGGKSYHTCENPCRRIFVPLKKIFVPYRFMSFRCMHLNVNGTKLCILFELQPLCTSDLIIFENNIYWLCHYLHGLLCNATTFDSHTYWTSQRSYLISCIKKFYKLLLHFGCYDISVFSVVWLITYRVSSFLLIESLYWGKTYSFFFISHDLLYCEILIFPFVKWFLVKYSVSCYHVSCYHDYIIAYSYFRCSDSL